MRTYWTRDKINEFFKSVSDISMFDIYDTYDNIDVDTLKKTKTFVDSCLDNKLDISNIMRTPSGGFMIEFLFDNDYSSEVYFHPDDIIEMFVWDDEGESDSLSTDNESEIIDYLIKARDYGN